MRCAPGMDQETFERKLYVVLKRAENEVARFTRGEGQELLLHPVALLANDRI